MKVFHNVEERHEQILHFLGVELVVSDHTQRTCKWHTGGADVATGGVYVTAEGDVDGATAIATTEGRRV